MIKTAMKSIVALSFSLVCFAKGDQFCVNPDYVVAVLKGVKGTMIITNNGEFITNENYTDVALKLGAKVVESDNK